MMFLIIMVLFQLIVLIPLLVMVIRERWPWLLSAAFVVNEATLLYFWAAPCVEQDPFSAVYLFYAGPVSALVCGVLLNWVLPPLPTRLAQVCHPQGLILVYALVLFLWAPFVVFAFFIGSESVNNNYIISFQYVETMIQIFLMWLGFTLLFLYLYRAARRSAPTAPDLLDWGISRMDHDESLDSERGRRTHIHKR